MSKGQELALSPTTDASYRSLVDEEQHSNIKINRNDSNRGSRFSSLGNGERTFGNNKVFWFRNGEPVITFGPHWHLFLITWVGMIAGGIFFYTQLAADSSETIKMLTIGIIAGQAFIYLFVALKNPGITTAQDPSDPNLYKLVENRNFCMKCRIIREEGTYHCFDCKVCIKGYDHHCPWTGKCIGRGNLRSFYVFLASTTLYIVYFITMSFKEMSRK